MEFNDIFEGVWRRPQDSMAAIVFRIFLTCSLFKAATAIDKSSAEFEIWVFSSLY